MLPANPDAADASANAGAQPGATLGQTGLGLTLAPLTPDTSSQLNLPNNARGAVIVDVKPNSPADRAGLQAGDLLVGVGTTAITGADQAVSAIYAAKSGGPVLAPAI